MNSDAVDLAAESAAVEPGVWGPAWGLLLTACGGGSDAGSASAVAPPVVVPPAVVVGSATGVFSDAAVQGLAFSTSSGVTGTTDALGRYTYNPNDSVTFKLGAVTVGIATASPIVTPVELAAGSANRLQNLPVLLQSLDDDGLPANGIKIPAAAAAAVTASIDLAQALAGFASAANIGLTAAMMAGGIGRSITPSAQAQRHFLDQAKALLSSQVWVGQYDNGAGLFVQRFGAAGESLSVQIGSAEGGGSSGVEFGVALPNGVDARGFKLSPAIAIDTNGRWGLSSQSACERVRVTGDQQLFLDAAADCVTTTTTTLSKAENDPAGIVCVWAVDTATVVKTQTFVFWANGKCAMADPIGDTVHHCGGPGVEYGTYSYNAGTQVLKVLSVTLDTNGCAGFHEDGQALPSFNVRLSSDGSSASVNAGEFTMYRVSR